MDGFSRISETVEKSSRSFEESESKSRPSKFCPNQHKEDVNLGMKYQGVSIQQDKNGFRIETNMIEKKHHRNSEQDSSRFSKNVDQGIKKNIGVFESEISASSNMRSGIDYIKPPKSAIEFEFLAELNTSCIIEDLVEGSLMEIDRRHLKRTMPTYLSGYMIYCCSSGLSQANMFIENYEEPANTFSNNIPDEPARLPSDNWVRNKLPVHKTKFRSKSKPADDRPPANMHTQYAGKTFLEQNRYLAEINMDMPTNRRGSANNYEGMTDKDHENDMMRNSISSKDNTNFFSTKEDFKMLTYDEKVKPVPVDIADLSEDDDLAKLQNNMRTCKVNKLDSEHYKNNQNYFNHGLNKGRTFMYNNSKGKSPNYTFDYLGNQIFFEKARLELLNPLIVDAKAHVVHDKKDKIKEKGLFLGRKRNSHKKKRSEGNLELPKVLDNARADLSNWMEPRKHMSNMELNPGVKLRTGDFFIEKKAEEGQIRTASGKLRCSRSYFEKIIRGKTSEDYYQ